MSVVDLNGIFNGLSGKSGNVVFVQTGGKTVMRQRVKPHNPDTAPQVAARSRMRRALNAYSTLSATQLAAWHTYAATLSPTMGKGSKTSMPRANNVFIGLTCKFLQVTPAGSAPLTPPAAPFLGDGITVTATATTTAITFTPSGPNATNIKTELLLQSLPSAQRAPQMSRYRTQQFIAFGNGVLTASIPLAAGSYAPAIRFVNAATGQETGIIPLPLVKVG